MMAVWWLWACGALALADSARSATSCQAVFIGPTEHCSWSEMMIVAGTGPNLKRAERAATQRLMAAASSLAQVRVLQTSGTLAAVVAVPEQQQCLMAVEERTRLTCFPSSDLGRTASCAASFPDDACWEPQVIVEEGTAWRAHESSHTALCQQVEQAMQTRGLSPVMQQDCMARCTLEANVRCTPAP